MDVEVCHARPDGASRVALVVDEGCTVADAVSRSGLGERPGLAPGTCGYAIFGRRASGTTVLAPGDRIELLRPLQVDPMDARRRRAAKKTASKKAVDEPAA